MLTEDYKFNTSFNYKNKKFSVSHWFKNLNEDLKLNNVREWLMMKELNFIEQPFYDSIRLIVNNQVELQFHSKLAYHKDPEEWQKDSPENLNWQLGAFYVT